MASTGGHVDLHLKVYVVYVSRTNIDLDDRLVEKVMQDVPARRPSGKPCSSALERLVGGPPMTKDEMLAIRGPLGSVRLRRGRVRASRPFERGRRGPGRQLGPLEFLRDPGRRPPTWSTAHSQSRRLRSPTPSSSRCWRAPGWMTSPTPGACSPGATTSAPRPATTGRRRPRSTGAVASRASRRAPGSTAYIAAVALRNAIPVLHHDADFDGIAACTGLEVVSGL